jgi:hypothetical protein
MTLKEINISLIEFIGDVAINVVTPEGYLYMIPDADTSTVSGQVTQTDDFIIEGDYLLWNNQQIDLNQSVDADLDLNLLPE